MSSFLLHKGSLLGLILGAFLILGGATAVRADDWGRRCDNRIAHERAELDRAIARHGYYSRQADLERRELDRLYAECRR